MKFHRLIFFCAILITLLGVCGFNRLPKWWGLAYHPTEKSLLDESAVKENKNIAITVNNKDILTKSSSWVDQKIRALKTSANNIDTNILRLSLIAYQKAEKGGIAIKQQLLTVIDYSKPSTTKRLWVFDLKNNKTIFNTWVSHGRNSGGIVPTSFSNNVGSLKSSIGVFLTDQPYYGGKGYSLRIKGLEHGINDKAYQRNVVFHGASYINADTIRKYGQAGRSWGCPAVSTSLVRPLINTIKDKSLLFVYYPDKNWLNHSRFLTG